MLLAGIVAIGAAVLIFLNIKSAKHRQDHVNYDRPSLYYSAVQIVCGNCAGDSILPHKTFMDRHGYCEQCGGGSYILASEMGLNKRVGMVLQLQPIEGTFDLERTRTSKENQERPKLEPVPQMKIAV